MRARRSIWVVVRAKDGLFDVERDRRLIRAGIDRTRALRLVQERMADGDTVFEVDSDGTQVNITRRVRMLSSRR